MTSMQDALKRGRQNVAAYLAATGVRCTVEGLTYNSGKDLYEPPYVTKKAHVFASISSLASIRDPNITTVVQSLNISFEAYRQISIAAGTVEIKPDDLIVKEPVTTQSDAYQVVEAVQADETSPLSLILHCRKLESKG